MRCAPAAIAAEMGERRDEADGAVAAHAEVSDVVEEDHAGGAARIDGLAEQGADDEIGTARLVDHGGAELIEIATEALAPLGHRAGAEIGPAAMTTRVGSPAVWESMIWILRTGIGRF